MSCFFIWRDIQVIYGPLFICHFDSPTEDSQVIYSLFLHLSLYGTEDISSHLWPVSSFVTLTIPQGTFSHLCPVSPFVTLTTPQGTFKSVIACFSLCAGVWPDGEWYGRQAAVQPADGDVHPAVRLDHQFESAATAAGHGQTGWVHRAVDTTLCWRTSGIEPVSDSRSSAGILLRQDEIYWRF